MKILYLDDFFGSHQISSVEDLTRALARRNDEQFNAFTFGADPGGYPWMMFLACGELAYVHYFPAESHAGFHSLGHLADLDEDGLTLFRMETPEQVTEVCNYQIISSADAVAAAVQFFETGTQPACLEWEEL